LEAEPGVEVYGGEVGFLDLKVELLGPVVGGPSGPGLQHRRGDAAAAVLRAGRHAKHSCPAAFDHHGWWSTRPAGAVNTTVGDWRK
jgi:hypothetical protein